MKLPKELREKGDLSGTASKSKKCSVNRCNEIAIRSLAENKWGKYMERAKLKYQENRLHKIFLCKTHYKEANKVRKSDEKLYQKKGFLDDVRGVKKGRYLD
ncbi:MAG: hypothetical protein ACTSQJ_15585 [Promethearchaeota archaeon]